MPLVLLLKVFGMLPGEGEGRHPPIALSTQVSPQLRSHPNVGRAEDGFSVDPAQETQACSSIPLPTPPHGQL